MSKIYKNDVGIQFILDTGQSLTGATKMQIKVKKPSGRLVTWTATAYDSTSITYTTIAKDLSESGLYHIQAYVEWTTASTHLGSTVELFIYPPYV